MKTRPYSILTPTEVKLLPEPRIDFFQKKLDKSLPEKYIVSGRKAKA
jgi:hypothetical protein